MKELLRFAGYTTITVIMIFILIEVAQSGVSGGTLALWSIIIVVVLPVILAIWADKRSRRKKAESGAE